MGLLKSCAFTRPMERGEYRVALRVGTQATFSRALHGRAQQAAPLRGKNSNAAEHVSRAV